MADCCRRAGVCAALSTALLAGTAVEALNLAAPVTIES